MYELPENDDENEHLKLGDFGLAVRCSSGEHMSKMVGTPKFVAPEVLGEDYSHHADLWSLGVIAFEMLTGCTPWHGDTCAILGQVWDGTPDFSSAEFQGLSSDAKDFIQSLLKWEPEKRLSARRALQHPWLKSQTKANISGAIVPRMLAYAQAPPLRRAIAQMMAWSLPRQERASLRDMFIALDVDHSGTLCVAELKKFFDTYSDLVGTKSKALFDSLDATGNGNIGYSQFLASVISDSALSSPDVLRATFKRFDCDDTGVLTAERLRAVVGETFEGQTAEQLIQEADEKDDGTISYDEFCAYMKELAP